MCVCVIDLTRRRSCISCYLYVCVCYRPNEEKVMYFLLFVCVCVIDLMRRRSCISCYLYVCVL